MGEYADAVEKHGGIGKAARAMGIARSTFSDRIARERRGEPPLGKTKRKTQMKGTRKGISTEELLLKHSPEHQIANAAEQLEKDSFVIEAEFLRNIGVSGGYRHIVEREEFAKYRGKATGGVVYWSHPDSMKTMKEQHVLR